MQVERRTGKVHRPKTDILPLCQQLRVKTTEDVRRLDNEDTIKFRTRRNMDYKDLQTEQLQQWNSSSATLTLAQVCTRRDYPLCPLYHGRGPPPPGAPDHRQGALRSTAIFTTLCWRSLTTKKRLSTFWEKKSAPPREKILGTHMKKGPPPYAGMGPLRMVNPARVMHFNRVHCLT